MKVLICDDSHTNRFLLKILLEEANILDLHMATNGNEAIKLCEKHDFDIIFMDICMPEMDGFEATKIIKQQKKVKIIATTSKDLEDIRDEYEASGFDHYMPKPIDLIVFKKFIELEIASQYTKTNF